MEPHRTGPTPSCLILPYAPGEHQARLEKFGRPDILERWSALDRSGTLPRILAIPDAGGEGWAGAALITARPDTAYLKMVDVLGDIPAVAAAVLAYARSLDLVSVKWEGWTAAAAAIDAGFTELAAPRSVVGDLQPETGFVYWLHTPEAAEPGYYQQTTHFTCGAAAALMAKAHAGAINENLIDRTNELTLWREATNFMACEPVGLGVALHKRWPEAAVSVSLDTHLPVIVDFYPEADREWRSLLQQASREEARSLGMPIDGRRLSMEALRNSLEDNHQVLLLISLKRMLGFDVPHWVLCHGVVGGAMIIEDPWVQDSSGETWVDTHMLPVKDTLLGEMSTMEAAGYRGAVHLPDIFPGSGVLGK